MQTVKSTNKLIFWALVAIVVLLVFAGSREVAFGQSTTGTVATTALNVRSGPGTSYTSVALLSINNTVTIMDKVTDEEGTEWLYVLTEGGNLGYVSAKFIAIDSQQEYITEADFETMLATEAFPENYKTYLRELHAIYPQWVFKAAHTGLDWEAVIARESKVGTSLVASGSPSSWKSMEKGAYDFEKGQYIQYDSGGWVSASEQIVRYYMDPRNFINQVGIFQFLTHSFDPMTQTKEGLQRVIQNSFMSGEFPEETHETYADVLMEAGAKSGVNPYVLASMILVEQGSSGNGGCISGTVSGYEGYYNFFNIGAYKSGSMSAVQRGVWYASQSGSYERPWDSRYKSILGGGLFYASNYVLQNKNTLYFKKFNVMNGSENVGLGQYMTNIQGAESEAAALRNGYIDALDTAMTFIIPVYQNMPEEVSAKPVDGNNNTFLTEITLEGYSLTPEFDRYKTEYELIVDQSVTSINVSAKASSQYSSVEGTGTVILTEQTTPVVITVTAQSGQKRSYIITVSKGAGGQLNQNQPAISSNKYIFDVYMKGVNEKTDYYSFISGFTVTNGSHILYNSKNEIVTSGNVGTGMTLAVTDKSGNAAIQYVVSVRGDVTGDGKINSADALAIQKHIVGSRSIEGAYLDAADINQDGRVNSLDVLFVQKHAVGSYTIEN